MSDQTKEQKSFGMTFPFVLPNVTETLQDQMRALLAEQAELFEEAQKAMSAWTRRRQEAIEAGAQTFQAMCGCKDPGTMAALYAEWVKASMNRVLADMNDTRADALRLAEIGQKSVTAAFRQTADATAPRGRAGAKDAGRAAGAERAPTAHKTHEHEAAE